MTLGTMTLLLMLVLWQHFSARIAATPLVPATTIFPSSNLPPLARLEPKLVRLLSLGEPRLYQSYLTYWVERVFANPELKTEQAHQLFADYDVLVKHEPKSEWFYLGPCLVFSERLQRPDLCFSITGYGQKQLPESWRLPLVQALVESNRLNRGERARFYLEAAAKKPGAPAEVNALLQSFDHGQSMIDEALVASLVGELQMQRFKVSFRKDG
jgi:hypothetical protein